jgi:hypothetical protein
VVQPDKPDRQGRDPRFKIGRLRKLVASDHFWTRAKIGVYFTVDSWHGVRPAVQLAWPRLLDETVLLDATLCEKCAASVASRVFS